jgi:uncharacterized protein YoaH (UPF0181 family)
METDLTPAQQNSTIERYTALLDEELSEAEALDRMAQEFSKVEQDYISGLFMSLLVPTPF